MENSNDIPADARAAIGNTSTRSYLVTEKDIVRFAQAISDKNPSYQFSGNHDDSKPLIAPPLFGQVYTYEEFPTSDLPDDGSPGEINVPLPASRTVGGSSEYQFFGQFQSGDRITVTSELLSIERKNARSGILFIVSVETRFKNQPGK